jgi:hypothetical protein
MTNPQEWKLFRDRVLESAKAIFAPHGTPAGFPSGWQTGLIIDPGSFSEQLNRLQYSLHRANQPVIDQEGDLSRTQASAGVRTRQAESPRHVATPDIA